MKNSVTAMDVAYYFLSLQEEEAGDLISHMKLQKLLYYVQGLHLALNGQPLFDDTIEAWTHGPVVPTVYHEFKRFGGNPIPVQKSDAYTIRDESTVDFLNEVYDVFGQYSAWKLRNMTHGETPYLEAEASQDEISEDSMRQYFRRYITA